MSTGFARSAIGAILLLLLAGCQEADRDAIEPSSSNAASTRGIITLDETLADYQGGFWLAAEIVGKLTTSDGCLYVGGLPAVWPADMNWDADAEQVSGLGWTGRLGDEVSLGGGVIPESGVAEQVSLGESGKTELRRCMKAAGKDSYVLTAPTR